MKQNLTADQRESIALSCLSLALKGQLSEGKLIAQLRRQLLGMNQSEFAELTGVSRRVLSDIENDRGTATAATLNAVLEPFGLRLGILPTSLSLTQQLFESFNAETGLPLRIKRLKSY